MENKGFFDRFNEWMRTSTVLKLITIGFITLILLIPTSMITSLINERKQLRDNVSNEVSGKWGKSQIIYGPFISVPFPSVITEEGKTRNITEFAHFFPTKIDITGNLSPTVKSRSIYNVMLYNSKLSLKGKFESLNVSALKIDPKLLEWDKAEVNMGISDVKGIRSTVNLVTNGKTLPFNPGLSNDQLMQNGMHTLVQINPNLSMDFEVNLDLNGSTSLRFVPIGKETNVSLTSTWGSPSFIGDYLPENPKVNNQGFDAKWKVLHFNRNFDQQGVGNFVGIDVNEPIMNDLQQNAYFDNSQQENRINNPFGVRLLLPVDEYQKNNRSVKYAVMLILLTFTTFFFIEILNKKKFHPIQYLLVGFSIVLFYILLLSLSEHIHFNTAYWIGCLITLGMVVLYSKAVFQSMKMAGIVLSVMGLFYVFFYTILQLEDYALLMGSAGLVIILATVMYITRNVDWYNARRDV